MPGAVVNRIAVVLDGTADRFNGAIQGASKKLSDFQKNNATLGQTLGNVKSKILAINPAAAIAVTAVAALGAAIVGATVKSAKYAEQLQKDAIRIGTTTEALSELTFAADQSGASGDALVASLDRLNRAAGEAVNGNQMLVDEFDRLGISVNELRTLSPDQLFERAAEGLNKLPGTAAKAATGAQVFGRGVRSLKPLLEEGGAGIAALREEARTLGRTVSTEFANESADFVDNLGRLKSLSMGFGQSIGVVVLPVLNSFLGVVIDLGKKALPVVQEVLFGVVFQFRRMGAFVGFVVEKIKELLPGLDANQAKLAEHEATLAQTAEQYRQLRAEQEAQAKAERDAAIAAEQRAAADAARVESEQELAELRAKITEQLADDLPETLENLPDVIADVGYELEDALIVTISDAQGAAEDFLESLSSRASATFGRLVGYGNRFADTLVKAATEGGAAFGDFFKQLLKDIATAIVRALVLRFILGGTGVGFGNFFKDVGKILTTGALPAPAGGYGGGTQDVAALVSEDQGKDVAQPATIDSLLERLQQIRRPVVNVLDAGPMARIEFFEEVVRPRLKETEEDLGGIDRL